MTKLRFSLVAAVAAVAACWAGAPARAQNLPTPVPTLSTDVPVWQGLAFLTAVSGSDCTSNDINEDDFFTMIYRQLPRPSHTTYGGGIQFASERSAFSLVMPASTNLNGGAQNHPSLDGFGESSEAGPFSFTGGFDLTISPAPITSTTDFVTITGTVSSFFGFSGCTATIRAALALRP
jgi:hypothetical protein